MRALTSSQSGFTLPELLVAMAVATLLASVVVSINISFLGSVMQSKITAEMAAESHFVLQTMIDDIRLSDHVAALTTITDANQTGGWATSDTNNILVLNSPVINASRDIVYDSDSGFPYSNELIYFISNRSLYKRTLKNESAAGNIAVTSCPAGAVTPSCPVDKQYTTYIDDLTFEFFDNDNNPTTDVSLARSVKIGLVMSRIAFGKTITLDNSIQTTLRNY